MFRVRRPLRHDTEASRSRTVRETRVVHDVHRRATSLLADVASQSSVPDSAAVEFRSFVVAMLQHHHRSEDTDLWPTLTSASPDLSDALDGLSEEHERLDAALEALNDHDARMDEAAETVRGLVHEHLSHEEPILFPALRRHVSEQVWAQFSQRTIETAPQEGTHLLLALLDEVAPPDDVNLILDQLPAQARSLVPANREMSGERAWRRSVHAAVGARDWRTLLRDWARQPQLW